MKWEDVMGNMTRFYRGRRVLVTGHRGFKGSWLCRILLGMGAEVTGYDLGPPTTPDLYSLAGLQGRLCSVTGDVRDLDRLARLFLQSGPEVVIHLAAQPIVREGYRDPAGTYATNVLGTVNVLECVRRSSTVRSVVNVTTDKVYDNREWCWAYRETDRLDGGDPYSNSKSCAELVTHSYVRSFLEEQGVAVSCLRAGNVIGGGDFARDRILPDCVRGAMAGQPIRLRAPGSVRPYQHVLEPLHAYLLTAWRQWEVPELAGCYNVGPDEADCIPTGKLASLFCEAWGGGARWYARPDGSAPHEADLLRLDCARIRDALGWRPRWNVERAVGETVNWTAVWLCGGDVPGEMDREIAAYRASGVSSPYGTIGKE